MLKQLYYSTISFSSSNPILAIVSYYDYLSVAPSYKNGINSSGIISWLSILKTFANFKNQYNQSAFEYDLMFVLTPTGSLEF